jgi:hypothetical protein
MSKKQKKQPEINFGLLFLCSKAVAFQLELLRA